LTLGLPKKQKQAKACSLSVDSLRTAYVTAHKIKIENIKSSHHHPPKQPNVKICSVSVDSLRTIVFEKRPTNVRRGLHMSKETYQCEKRPTYVRRQSSYDRSHLAPEKI